MDANVEKIKKLLETGYKIIHVEMKLDKLNGPGTIEHIVTLKKSESREVIHSVNSQEFLEFIIHFKQSKDKYDNSEFVYIQDLKKYDQMVQSEYNHEILQDHHILKISGRDFSKGITTISLKPGGRDNRIGTAQIWVDLDKNPGFKNINFKDEIEIRDRSNAVVMKGYIRNYQSSDKTGFLSIQDLTLKLESEKITVEFNHMNPTDSMGLLAESGGFPFHTDKPYNTAPRAFRIIVPIQNLIIDQTFKIGDVEFYQDFTSLDDALIRKSNTGRTNLLWNGNLPRARIQVTAHQFFEAITQGYDAICKAIEVISFRTDWTFPLIELDERTIFFMFSYYKYLSRVKGNTLVYCREVETQAHTFFNLESIIDNILSFEIDSQEYFAPVNELFDSILRKENLTDEESRILQVLHWLRKSIQEGNKKDKFLDLWVAFEFLTSGTSIPKLFQPDEVSNLMKLIETTGLTKEQIRAIQFRINQLNEPPQMAIFNHLIKTLGVEFTDAELKTLSTARKKRTDIIHGKKDPDIKAEELNKMRTILEKVLIKKISVLKS